MAASILVSREDHSEFKLLVGVADSTTFNERTTWGALDSYSQKCYIGDDAVTFPNLLSPESVVWMSAQALVVCVW